MLWFDRVGYGPADHVHPADELDAFFGRFIEFEYEAKDVARVDKANDDDVSGIRNGVGKDNLADACLDELTGSVLFGITIEVRVPFCGSKRPELALVVFQDLEVDQSVQGQIND